MLSEFEQLLFDLHVDQNLREIVRNNPESYLNRYSLSKQEIDALKNINWDDLTIDIWMLGGPEQRCCGGHYSDTKHHFDSPLF